MSRETMVADNIEIRIHASSVGNTIDVATPTSGKLKVLGFLWSAITLFPIFLLTYIILEAIGSDEPSVNFGDLIFDFGLLLMPLLAWVSLGNAVQRFQASSNRDRYLRAGPGGISVCVTDSSYSSALLFRDKMWKFDLAWDQIRTWYPYTLNVNGIPAIRTMVFETLKGEKISIPTNNFSEKQQDIADNISRARAQAQLAEASVSSASATSGGKLEDLPAGIGEKDIKIKRVKEPVIELDLTGLSAGDRLVRLDRTVGLIEQHLQQRLPVTEGYRYLRKTYRPFQEWAHLYGIRLFTRRGLFWGYEIQFEPNDSDCRVLKVSLCESLQVSVIRNYLSIIAGLLIFLLSVYKLNLLSYLLKEPLTLVVIILFFGAMASIGLCVGLLQIPIHLFRRLFTDKEKQKQEKEDLKREIGLILSRQ